MTENCNRPSCKTCGSTEQGRRFRVGENDEPCRDAFHTDPRDFRNQQGSGVVQDRRNF